MERDRPVRIHQAIARQLGTDILTGVLQPGAAIEGEVERSEALGVSRTAYREAIRILVAKGLVESRPRAGTRVTERARWNLLDPEVLAWTFSGPADQRFVRELFELRGIVEPAAAALAAERRSEQDLAAMAQALAAMRRFGLATDAGRAADQDFHRAILAATRNDALASLSSSVGAAVSWTTRFKQRLRPLPRDPLPEHEAVHAAIAARLPERARAAMHKLLELALADMQPFEAPRG